MSDAPVPLHAPDAAPEFEDRAGPAFRAGRRLPSGSGMADEPIRRRVVIANPLGLHLRPAMAFAQLAQGYESRVRVRYEDKEADGKSQLDLILLVVMPGGEVDVEVSGRDAAEAMAALVRVLAAQDAEGLAPPPKG